MKAKVAALGYERIKTFKVSGDCYEIYGYTKDGKKAEVYFNRKRRSGAVHSAGLKFHGISASISLFGHRLAIRSRVCLAQALGSASFILQV